MIICLVGPTGVGKTKISIELAKKYNAIIINCDAMQVYKYLNIGTAKIKEEEKENIPHFLFDIVNIGDNYSVYDYQKDLRKLLAEYKNQNIIIVGGTGLYLKSGLFDYEFSEDENINDYSSFSNEELFALVKEIDSNTLIHVNNRVRLERFLNKKDHQVKETKLLYDAKFIGLTLERDTLYQRIDKRVDKMFEDGLLDEVKKIYDQKIKWRPLENGIGYKEIIKYFNNEISLEDAKELIKKNSRHYAKRQYTFFNNQLDVKWFNVNLDNLNETIKEIENYLSS